MMALLRAVSLALLVLALLVPARRRSRRIIRTGGQGDRSISARRSGDVYGRVIASICPTGSSSRS